MDGQASWVDEGFDGAFVDEVAGCAVASPRDRARVLEASRDGGHERGGRRGCWCVSGGRRPLVPPWWRNASYGSGPGNWPLLVVRRARRDRVVACSGWRGEIDRSPDRPVPLDGVSRATTQRCDSWRQARVSGVSSAVEGGPRRAATQDRQARRKPSAARLRPGPPVGCRPRRRRRDRWSGRFGMDRSEQAASG